MSSPQEKAKELVKKYGSLTVTSHKSDKVFIPSRDFSKQCAIIAVDEIINANGLHPNDTDYDYNKAELYWQQVKQELQNL